MNRDSHRVLTAIETHVAAGRQPTYRALAAELRLGVSNVHRHVHALADQGLVRLSMWGSGKTPAILLPDGLSTDVLDRLSDAGLRNTAKRIADLLAERATA